MAQKKKKKKQKQHRSARPDAREADNEKEAALISPGQTTGSKPDSVDAGTEESGRQPKPPGGKKKEGEAGPPAVEKAVSFLKDVNQEYKKITWPDRQQTIQETVSVLLLVAFITVLVLGYDYALAKFVFGPIEHQAKLMKKPVHSNLTPLNLPGQQGPLPLSLPLTAPGKPDAGGKTNGAEGKSGGAAARSEGTPAKADEPTTPASAPAPTGPAGSNPAPAGSKGASPSPGAAPQPQPQGEHRESH